MSEFHDRLRRLRVELDEETLAAQRAEISQHLARYQTSRRRGRLRLVAVVAALLVSQAAVVLASEGSVPGDVLYPAKRFYEQPWSWVDQDIVLRHRVEEAEHMVDHSHPDLERAIEEATRSTTPESDPTLTDRLDRLIERTDRPPGSDRPTDVAPTTTTVPDGTTVPQRDTTDGDSSSTTSTSEPARDAVTTTTSGGDTRP